MFNYLKFAIYQIIGFISSLPLIRKFTKNPHKYSSEEKFKFLKDQASKSLDLVNIILNIFLCFNLNLKAFINFCLHNLTYIQNILNYKLLLLFL